MEASGRVLYGVDGVKTGGTKGLQKGGQGVRNAEISSLMADFVRVMLREG